MQGYDRQANQQCRYVVNLTIGTPAKQAILQVDTGSSNLFFQSLDSNFCQAASAGCSNYTSYRPKTSTSAVLVGRDTLNLTYASQTVLADEYLETVRFGNASLSALRVGVVDRAVSRDNSNVVAPWGIVGLAPAASDGTGITTKSVAGPTLGFLPALQSSGVAQSQAFSLFFDTPGEIILWLLLHRTLSELLANSSTDTGSVIFGGINSDKFEGNLQVMPLVKESGLYIVNLASMTLGHPVDANKLYIDVSLNPYALFDTGSSLTRAPHSVVQPIYDRLQVKDSVIDCSYLNSTEQFTVVLGTKARPASFSVPLSNFIMRVGGSTECLFTIADLGSSYPNVVFGDEILRSLYVVYDPDDLQLGIAPLNMNSNGSKIQPIISGQPLPGTS